MPRAGNTISFAQVLSVLRVTTSSMGSFFFTVIGLGSYPSRHGKDDATRSPGSWWRDSRGVVRRGADSLEQETRRIRGRTMANLIMFRAFRMVATRAAEHSVVVTYVASATDWRASVTASVPYVTNGETSM